MSNKDIRSVDPLFAIPDELGDFEYAKPVDMYGFEVNEEEGTEQWFDYNLEDDYSIEYEEGEEDLFESLDSPEVTVVEQIIRTQPNGTQVADLILDVEDVDLAEKYEFRVVKL